MAKVKVVHRCSSCGTAWPRWSGRCGSCGEWNTLAEEAEISPAPRAVSPTTVARPVRIADVDARSHPTRSTGVGELDRVLGGGFVPGSVTLLGGEPGIGKSTLLLQAMASMAKAGARCLLACAEESTNQVRVRAARLGALEPSLWLLAETALAAVLDAVDEVRPDVLVVDSIQTVADVDLGSAAGSVAQVRWCTQELVQRAKDRSMAVVLVGHVTKDGALAGPRALEHMVDTVLSFEGERHHALRLLRAVKHRFGATGELGLFEMAGVGLREVPDPSALFLGDRTVGVAGSSVVPAMEGSRPLVVEIQALVANMGLPQPRRSAQGLDGGRLALLLAVLQSRCGVVLKELDVYTSAVGGVRLTEPAADLAIALALTSAVCGHPLPADLVACGEVGLGGEVRQVAHIQRRLAEAARLGFSRAIVPLSVPEVPGIELIRVRSLLESIGRLGLAVQ